ncbi:MAG: NAD(P)H-hydrate dehydratase [Ruminococcus sp.]|nr:NAD(P)H-hydrate dehydratase [Ruminococcus sp.]
MEERILTVEQMVFCERYSDSHGVSLGRLMDNAGRELGRHIFSVCSTRGVREPLILAGKGNNGGDGFVAAAHLFEKGLRPTVMLCCGAPATDLAVRAFEAMPKAIPVIGYDGTGLCGAKIGAARVLVDCIFGTGFRGSLPMELVPLFEDISGNPHFTVACDLPSGVDARSGQCCKGAVRADLTVTMHAPKLGMMLSPAKYLVGRLEVCDIGIPESSELSGSPEMQEKIYAAGDMEYYARLLPKRPPDGHKGTFGKLICLCGSEHYIGAAGLSVTAALRTGAGLVELFTPRRTASALAAGLYECIYTAAPSDEDGFVTSEVLPELLDALKKADALLIGCGLGCTKETSRLVAALIERSPVPVILDADGINSIAANIDILLKKSSEVVLTPHPGELARLCGASLEEVARDRHGYAAALARKYGVTVISKSAETLVCHGSRTQLITAGNTALSKGGSGDILAGITASLIAQSPRDLTYAVQLSPYILGKTAELLSEDRSQRGLLPRDILDGIPVFLKKLETASEGGR